MAWVETCHDCGTEIPGDTIPQRVLGRVLCPSCDSKRVLDLNRRDRVPILVGFIAVHGLFALFLTARGVSGALEWWAARRITPEETSIVPLLASLVLLPAGAVFAWVTRNLWRLEGRGRISAILLDVLVACLCVYWFLNGERSAAIGAVAVFSAWYLARSATGDRFW